MVSLAQAMVLYLLFYATVFTVNANDQLANRPFFVQFD